MRTIHIILIIFLVFTKYSIADYTSFLIVERPVELTIFNKYEQFFENKDKLPAFAPFQIIEENSFLSDNLTPVMKVSLDGKAVYILKNNDGSPAGLENSGFNEILRKCILTGDTLIMPGNKNVTVYQTRELAAKGSRQLIIGERIIRLFRNGRLYYIQRSRPHAGYGWIKRTEAALLKKAVPKSGSAAKYLAEDTKRRISLLMESVNENYIKYFAFLNKLKNENRQAPQWQKTESDSLLSFTLSSKEYFSSLKLSNEELFSSINLILNGSKFSAGYDEELGTVFITKKQPDKYLVK